MPKKGSNKKSTGKKKGKSKGPGLSSYTLRRAFGLVKCYRSDVDKVTGINPSDSDFKAAIKLAWRLKKDEGGARGTVKGKYLNEPDCREKRKKTLKNRRRNLGGYYLGGCGCEACKMLGGYHCTKCVMSK